MGTNYYMRCYEISDVDKIKRDVAVQKINNGYIWHNQFYNTLEDLAKDYYEEIHVGKSSAGWVFLLHIHPDKNIYSLEDYCNIWYDPNIALYNEYDELISPKQLEHTICDRALEDDRLTQAEIKQFCKENQCRYDASYGLFRYDLDEFTIPTSKSYDITTKDFS